MIVKLLTEHNLKFLSLEEGNTGSSESTLVKMPHCWKSHVMAHFITISFVWNSFWNIAFKRLLYFQPFLAVLKNDKLFWKAYTCCVYFSSAIIMLREWELVFQVCVVSSGSSRLVCSLWVWHFLVILINFLNKPNLNETMMKRNVIATKRKWKATRGQNQIDKSQMYQKENKQNNLRGYATFKCST